MGTVHPPAANIVANMLRNARKFSGATGTAQAGNIGGASNISQDTVKQGKDVLWMSGRGKWKIRVDWVGMRKKSGESGLEIPIVNCLVRDLDGRTRIRAYQRFRRVFYSTSAGGYLECLA